MSGKLYIVATPIGNLEDITLRAIRVLKEVDLIAAEDTRYTRKLLTHFDIHTKLTSFFKGNENQKTESVMNTLREGSDVALVSNAGTPCISDPGYPLVTKAIEEGIAVVPIPGASALATAVSAAGLPTDRFTFVGFLPDKPGKRKKSIESLKDIPHTLVLYVSPYKAAKTINECCEILGDRRACFCREMTKMHEEFMRSSLAELAKLIERKPPKGEIVLVIASQ